MAMERSHLHVLIVEDHTDTRILLELLFRNSGFTVEGVDGVAEAVAAFQRRRPDLIICDLAMPDSDGFSFIQRVRGMREGARGKLPAIALSAFSDEETIHHSLRVGFNRYLRKPVSVDRLMDVVHEVLSEN
jgi:CheY-like chemotaxis protein